MKIEYLDPLDGETEQMRVAAPAPVIVAGLSDEEDAARHLARRFDPNLRFCTNCEVHYDKLQSSGDEIRACPRCGNFLALPDTPPTKRKHT